MCSITTIFFITKQSCNTTGYCLVLFIYLLQEVYPQDWIVMRMVLNDVVLRVTKGSFLDFALKCFFFFLCHVKYGHPAIEHVYTFSVHN